MEIFESYRSLGALYASAMHPNDEKRLCHFILSLDKHDHDFNADLFCRWLEEADPWLHDYASILATRVDAGLTLLKLQKFVIGSYLRICAT